MTTHTGPGWTLYQGDCMDVLPTLAAGSVDAVITDPPYGTTACAWDSVIPLAPMWAELKRLVKPSGAVVLFGSFPFTGALWASNPQWFKYAWVWAKSQPGDCMNAKNKPMKAHEDILVFSSGTTANGSDERMPYYPQGLRPSNRKRTVSDNNPGRHGGSFKPFRLSHHPYTQEWTEYPSTVLHFDNERNTLHPTQKPVDLLRYLIRTYTNPGETVLDFTMGSGTTGVAAIMEGRRFVGVELDENYYEIARKRITEAAMTVPLFPFFDSNEQKAHYATPDLFSILPASDTADKG